MPDRIWAAEGDTPYLHWAQASRPMRGQAVSGDRSSVLVSGPRTILAAIDGLGHGAEAAEAARLAAEIIDHNPAEPLDVLLLLAHRGLADSRGAAATVAIVDADRGTMQWVGVGNVDGVLIRADIEARPRSHGVFLVSGALGYHLGRLHIADPLSLEHGDLIVLATDGVRADLADVVRVGQPVERQAQTVIAKYARPDDDALVLIARYVALQAGPSDQDGDDWTLTYRPLNRPGPVDTDDGDDGPVYGPLGPSSTR
jgi:phosphoserine phosphatase RsbX